eukprot:m.88783 g.88783  ORF g.88783 m.88783 type:complete len:73 (-) comp8816_c3_seq1:1799-2017(-)
MLVVDEIQHQTGLRAVNVGDAVAVDAGDHEEGAQILDHPADYPGMNHVVVVVAVGKVVDDDDDFDEEEEHCG